MTEVTERLIAELAELPARDRAELAHHLILSLDEGTDPDAEAAWDSELARRVEEIRAGQIMGEPAADIFSRIREQPS